MLDSKTIKLWLLIFGIGLLVVLAGAVYVELTGNELPYVDQFFALLGIGGGGATARNVLTDGPIRKQQALGDYPTEPPEGTP